MCELYKIFIKGSLIQRIPGYLPSSRY